MAHLKLKHIGIDSWDRPVYIDQYNNLWKDISLSKNPDMSTLHTVSDNTLDGEPDYPMDHYENVHSYEIV